MQTAPANHKVIFDTDPGVDDAIALYFALAHPDIELLGITTTFGNVSVQQASANALYLTRLAGYRRPIAQGVQFPQLKTPGKHPDFVHGNDGLGNLHGVAHDPSFRVAVKTPRRASHCQWRPPCKAAPTWRWKR